jgi:hypothetical protein
MRISSRPPQVRAGNLHHMQPPHLHCKVWAVQPKSGFLLSGLLDFVLFWKLVRLALPYIRFLFVGSGFCLRLPSDPTSRWAPLPLANTSYCQVCSGLSPPSYRPCWAHKKRRAYPPFFTPKASFCGTTLTGGLVNIPANFLNKL